MKILKKFFKFSFICFLTYPNKIALTDNSQKKIIKWNQLENSSNEFNKPKWEKINDFDLKKYKFNEPKWEKINDYDYDFDFKKEEEKIDFSNIYKEIENKELEFGLTQLGITVPTAHTLQEGLWNVYGDQVFPISEGSAGGSANQNYSIFFNYGITENKMISTFFAIADDPLHKKISKSDSHPANLWLNLGSGLKYKIIDGEKLDISIDSSLEYWKMKSGGCNAGFGSIGSGCTTNSANIFNNNIKPVVNNNFIGSVAIPTTYDFSKFLNFTLVPKFTFLPETQGNEYGSGKFYGSNFGLGLGLSYMPHRKFKTYSSFYIPLTGKNSFNQDLNFEQKIISTLGFLYSFDTKTAVEGYLTNSFGSTPSTSILTLPSSNELIIGSRFIYTPSGLLGSNEPDPIRRNQYFTSNLSVNNTFLLGYGKILSELNVSEGGSFWKRLKFGISDKFDIDMSWETFTNSKKGINQFVSQYLTPGSHSARIGGKVLLFGNNSAKSFNTALRLSLGRKVFSDDWSGYFFSELINSYHLNNNLSFQLNPKLANANKNFSGVGISADYKIFKNLTIKAEHNLAIENAEDNTTISIRKSFQESKFVDIYSSNSYSFIDKGQLQKSTSQKYGLRVGIVF